MDIKRKHVKDDQEYIFQLILWRVGESSGFHMVSQIEETIDNKRSRDANEDESDINEELKNWNVWTAKL